MTHTQESTGLKNLEANIEKELNSIFYLQKDENGIYHGEIYADYRDEMSNKDAVELLTSAITPMDAFANKLSEWYIDAKMLSKDELLEDIKNNLTADDGTYPEGFDDEQAEFLEQYIEEHVYFDYPSEHYLKQRFRCEVTIDTGDGNYDFTLNCHYPCWYGPKCGESMDNKAGILWLAKQQGYTKHQLLSALDEGDMKNASGFLESVRVEMANLASHMSTVTFLVSMTFEELAKINRLLQIRDKDGYNYESTKRPDVGYIVLDKSTMCGLFDPWSGGGSVLDIQLEKDVKIPLKNIRYILPDGGDGNHSVDSVYGLIARCWKETLKEIHIPVKFQL